MPQVCPFLWTHLFGSFWFVLFRGRGVWFFYFFICSVGFICRCLLSRTVCVCAWFAIEVSWFSEEGRCLRRLFVFARHKPDINDWSKRALTSEFFFCNQNYSEMNGRRQHEGIRCMLKYSHHSHLIIRIRRRFLYYQHNSFADSCTILRICASGAKFCLLASTSPYRPIQESAPSRFLFQSSRVPQHV